MIFLPDGIFTPKLVSVKEQPMPMITSDFARNSGTARDMATPAEPSESGWVSGKVDLPPSEVTTGRAISSASFLICGQAWA